MKNKKHISLIAFILFGLLLSACEKDIDANMSKEMQDLSFITQDNETFIQDELHGELWITYFSYTDWRIVWPLTTSNMVEIQYQLKKEGLAPPIISFNVNSEKDGLEELCKYAEEKNVDS